MLLSNLIEIDYKLEKTHKGQQEKARSQKDGVGEQMAGQESAGLMADDAALLDKEQIQSTRK